MLKGHRYQLCLVSESSREGLRLMKTQTHPHRQLWNLLSLAVLSRAPSLVHAEFSTVNALHLAAEQGLMMSLIEPLMVSYGGVHNKATS